MYGIVCLFGETQHCGARVVCQCCRYYDSVEVLMTELWCNEVIDRVSYSDGTRV